MGIVYRGVHTVFEEVVAIKAIFPELMRIRTCATGF